MPILRKALLAILSVAAFSLAAQTAPSLLPLPQKVEYAAGQFVVPSTIRFCTDAYAGDSVAHVFSRFCEKLTATAGIQFQKSAEKKAQMVLRVNSSLPAEGYTLHVDSLRVAIEASRPAGFFYALQTLQQLLPTRDVLAGKRLADGTRLTLPAVDIADAPRFSWRGFMLDEGRHFYGKKEVKRILDLMAAYKMNRFHWHLTEDQGWRIEIKKYPRLTQYSAWRNSKVLGWGETVPDGERYGGFYTQDEAREIVAYARERFIEIVPEIDLPGHSQAAVAAYPALLACDPDVPHDVWLYQGVSQDVVNVATPAAVQFAKDVVDELADVFPFTYLHLGGDECPTQKWRANADCQALLKQIGSENYRDLQIYFYKQLKDHIATRPIAHQRRLIFWNEALRGNTAPLGQDFTIMAWTNADDAAKEAARRGLTTILTPQIPYYINRRQSPLVTEPRSQGTGKETVEAVYSYEPQRGVDAALRPQYLGVQANFWTEWVEDAPKLEYLLLPRLAAVAEAAWTSQTQRQYPDFLQRLQAEPAFYKASGLNFAPHVFEGGE